MDWPVSEWMSLSPDRRVFLFDHARAFGGDTEKLDAIALGILDELIDAQDVVRDAPKRSREGATLHVDIAPESGQTSDAIAQIHCQGVFQLGFLLRREDRQQHLLDLLRLQGLGLNQSGQQTRGEDEGGKSTHSSRLNYFRAEKLLQKCKKVGKNGPNQAKSAQK